jgi:uncharacterized protein (TIGR03435 family)
LEYLWLSSSSPLSADGVPSEPAPDLASALDQQLGLKLGRRKASLEVLVIDHYDRVPTEN